jgi:hypothetical protein
MSLVDVLIPWILATGLHFWLLLVAGDESELGKKLDLPCTRCNIYHCLEDSYLTTDMVRRSQLSLLQSVFAVRKTSSFRKLLPLPGRPVCCHKFNSPPATPAHWLVPPFRRFATSPRLEKKGKATKDAPVSDNAADKGQQRSEMDPYDHTALESGIAKAIARLKEALTKTRSAGRISLETLENLPVQLSGTRGSGASGKESRRLGDVATVVPKGGRVMQVFVAQESVRLIPFPSFWKRHMSVNLG